jgi:uncharacterized membrane protein YhiD involved in acid resistance
MGRVILLYVFAFVLGLLGPWKYPHPVARVGAICTCGSVLAATLASLFWIATMPGFEWLNDLVGGAFLVAAVTFIAAAILGYERPKDSQSSGSDKQ